MSHRALAAWRRLLPSRQHILWTFAICSFPVYTWTIYQFLDRFPAWLYYLNLWEVLTIFAYTQAFALVESVVFLLVLLIVAAILPARFFRDNFVTVSSGLVLVTTGWALFATRYYDIVLQTMPMSRLLAWILAYGITIGVAYWLIQRYDRLVQAPLAEVAERLVVLLYVYVPIGLVGLIVVMLRNV